ncbi:MAG: hypothetical protein JST75_07470 [Bacteroidetes bacterium]|nr:hypothetical protein [Bacteroidota bacterium]
MKKLICIVIVVLGISSAGFSQHKSINQGNTYTSAIGIRLGTGYYDLFSASFKTFLAESPGALELNLGIKPNSYGYYYTGYNYNANFFNVSFSGAYQYHFDIAPVSGLKWFIGGGVTMWETIVSNNANNAYKSGFGIGLFPTGGADYKFGNIPLNVSIDLRPTFALTTPTSYYSNFYFSAGASVRYVFR